MGKKPKKGEKAGPYLVGSAISGVMEVAIFHPIDTTAKRLMSNTKNLEKAAAAKSASGEIVEAVEKVSLKKVIFAEAHDKGFKDKLKNMYPGIGFGTAYKILQRTYKFTAQPVLKGYLDRNYGDNFNSVFGKKLGEDMLHSTSGMFVGLGEIVLLPLDVLKIKAQTNPAALSGRGVGEIFRTEGWALYRGWNWTAMRNMPGSFALFGATSVVYSWVFDLDKHDKKTLFQTFCGSFMGGVASIAVSAPMDVIKTRIQNKPFDDPRSGAQVLGALFKNEGPSALFKGLVPKITLIGPKLVFSWTVAQWLANKLKESWPGGHLKEIS